MCVPRFDSAACFASLLGDESNGRWQIAPADAAARSTRAYREATFLLETTFEPSEGRVKLTDCMLLGSTTPRIVRTVEGLAGTVAMHVEYAVRFDYGSVVPWVRRTDGGLLAVGGPDALLLVDDVELKPEGMRHVADFDIAAGERVSFELTYFFSYEDVPNGRSADTAVATTQDRWRQWAATCDYDGPYREIVLRSLLALLALSYPPTGGILAAVTTSLPEERGGTRNWDYRYCWLRDATFTLYALLSGGYAEAAIAWRGWLLRAVAGNPSELQIVYNLRGMRRLSEVELPWLAGYEGARPVRIGNDAHGQFQLDVYGEVVDLLYVSHRFGIEHSDDEWALVVNIVEVVEQRWRDADRGLWEIRGEPQHFTHSKVMAWVALDRAVSSIEKFGLEGPLERWRAVRDEIHADVCARGYDSERGTFTQSYGSRALDASALLFPLVGFLPWDDPRMRGTVATIERELVRGGFVMRYTMGEGETPDGLPPGEGAFLACSFWLVDNYVLAGRRAEAEAFYGRLVALCNDVGLLSEEYDPQAKRQTGNFPQAFSHVGLINSSYGLWHPTRPEHARGDLASA
ncbi:MAG: glycoside hydrolase family 15 protein [Candidatus Eremiobacteraeota bacterium]|nr:glycoside hydrolase family 15 protein [Candidatus Eremiobacteraeota bacterium]